MGGDPVSVLHRRQGPADLTAAAFLDWRDSSHYSPRPLPCGSCGKSIQLRNDTGQPQHKTCAEAELEQSRKDGR